MFEEAKHSSEFLMDLSNIAYSIAGCKRCKRFSYAKLNSLDAMVVITTDGFCGFTLPAG